MQIEALEKAWRDQDGAARLEPVMAFGPKGLTLGAGTVLAADAGGDRSISIDDQAEARLCALLSAAYHKVIPPLAVRFIRRGAQSWRDGDHAMAAMHLAMTGLPRLHDPRAASKRLFMADKLMKAGAEPDVILRALDLNGAAGEDTLERYDPQQPRNPVGSGRVSGRWAHEGAQGGAGSPPQAFEPAKPPSPKPTAGRVAPAKPAPTRPVPVKAPPSGTASATAFPIQPPLSPIWPTRGAPWRTGPKPSLLETGARGAAPAEEGALAAEDGAAVLLDAAAVGSLAATAATLAGAAVFGSILLIPSNRTSPDEINIPGHPDMHLERGVGERLWRFVYKDQAGVPHTVLQDPDGRLKDAEGNLIGRILWNNAVALLRRALVGAKGKAEERVEREQPYLCPNPVNDYRGGGSGSESRLFEDKMKAVVNPDGATPSGLGYSFYNPDARFSRVIVDDCQRKTGIWFEAKGPGFSRMLKEKLKQFARTKDREMLNNIDKKIIRQGTIQTGAARLAGGKEIVWFFHDQVASNYVRATFALHDEGLEKITLGVLPERGPTHDAL